MHLAYEFCEKSFIAFDGITVLYEFMIITFELFQSIDRS